jgi:hypothetical protein
MRVVELRRRRPEDGEIERLARVYVRSSGEPASFEVLVPDLREGLERLIADGATDDLGRYVQLSDGEAFLAALPDFYHSSRFWAEEVEIEDES